VIAVIMIQIVIPGSKYKTAEKLLASGNAVEAALAYGAAGEYKDAQARSFELWGDIANRESFSAGGVHTVGLRSDGTVVTVGDNESGQCDVSDWSNIVAVSAGDWHTVGLRSDGTVVAVGDNESGQSAQLTVVYSESGQCDVSDWSNIVAVSAGDWHTVGLRSDGTVVAVGNNGAGECDVSGWSWRSIVADIVAADRDFVSGWHWRDIVAVSAGGRHTVGLRSDGTVVAVGFNEYDQCDVSSWSNIVAVSAGDWHTVGLRSDGTVVAVGDNEFGECDVSDWSNIVAISAGDNYTIGLRSDGTVVAVGDNESGQCDVSDWSNIVAVSAGGIHTVGLRSDGTVVMVGDNEFGQCDVSDLTDIKVPERKAGNE